MDPHFLTPRTVGEILFHEGLVREAYRDSVGVWTWSVGITSASGHKVERYRDDPQPIARCIEIYVWLLTTRYMPAVLAAFGSYVPSEHQIAAALSFHWNTGAIRRASWLKRFLEGDEARARAAILDWCRPPEVMPRRKTERDLFFDGHWKGDGTVAVYEVSKPGYRPVRPRRMEIGQFLGGVLEAGKPLADCESARIDEGAAIAPLAAKANWFERLFGQIGRE